MKEVGSSYWKGTSELQKTAESIYKSKFRQNDNKILFTHMQMKKNKR